MSSIVPSSTYATCNAHNALRNISDYACGVTFSFKDSENPPDMHFGVVSLQRCCGMVNAPVLRIPGNTACEIQFCEVDRVTSSYTKTIYHAHATGPGTAAHTPSPTVTEGATIGPPEEADNCMRFVYEGDLPDEVSDQILYASRWSAVRFYDDELPLEEVSAALLASPAPPSWSSAAAVADSGDEWLSSSRRSPLRLQHLRLKRHPRLQHVVGLIILLKPVKQACMSGSSLPSR
ncbi:hypothetical protein E0Z10_g9039 [Xylaria hypoxylon]|uniref:Uncharacterized protein n=1 Tax=Xylaria hypoxylon TaxID=37992 RepID=A0A4Z0YTF7_9PEZI|nr:hypothetical protein E0Z10_g9039 [Xylaria hypoxylon]